MYLLSSSGRMLVVLVIILLLGCQGTLGTKIPKSWSTRISEVLKKYDLTCKQYYIIQQNYIIWNRQ